MLPLISALRAELVVVCNHPLSRESAGVGPGEALHLPKNYSLEAPEFSNMKHVKPLLKLQKSPDESFQVDSETCEGGATEALEPWLRWGWHPVWGGLGQAIHGHEVHEVPVLEGTKELSAKSLRLSDAPGIRSLRMDTRHLKFSA